MLKQSVGAVVLLIALITPGASIRAQSVQRFKIDVPFQFILNGRTLPAGTYVVERTDPARPNVVTLKKVDGRIFRLVITQRVEKDNPSTSSSLIFIEREGKHYLFQVWNLGAMNGSQIPIDKDGSRQQQADRVLLTLRTRH